MAANDNLDLILRRYEEIGARLTEGVAGAEYSSLSRELADLEPVVAAIKAFRAKEKERDDLKTLLEDPALDPEMRGDGECRARGGRGRGRGYGEGDPRFAFAQGHSR